MPSLSLVTAPTSDVAANNGRRSTVADMTESAPVRHHDVTTRLVTAVQEDLPALLDAVVARIRYEIPLYARDEVVAGADLRASVAHNVEFIVAGLMDDPAGTDLTPPRTTGRARAAQGAPLVEMLTAYRIGFAETWSAMRETARALPEITDGALVELSGTIFSL